MQRLACLALLLLILLPTLAAAVEVTLTDDGIVSLRWEGWRHASRQVALSVKLPGVPVLEDAELLALPGGGIMRATRYGQEKQGTLVTERLLPSGDGLEWEVTLEGTGITWSNPIELILFVPEKTFPRWWTAWGTPDLALENQWQNPLATRPREARTLIYGGTSVVSSDAFSLPFVSLLAPSEGIGLSLLQAPSDLLRDMKLVSTTDKSAVKSNSTI